MFSKICCGSKQEAVFMRKSGETKNSNEEVMLGNISSRLKADWSEKDFKGRYSPVSLKPSLCMRHPNLM